MRTRGWVRLAVVAAVGTLTAIVFFGTATPAPATGTPPTIDFDNQPGLSSVTYGQNAAYVAHITNNGIAVLRNVTFHNPIPTTIVNGQPQQAVFQSSNCAGQVTATEFVCNVVAKLDTNQTATVTVAWKTPSAGSSPGCPTAASCMLTSASWGTSLRSYPMGPVATELLSGNDPSRAATYALSACTDPSAPTLATDQNVSSSNRLATSVCVPSLPPSGGLVTAIQELPKSESDPGTAPEVSDICIPAPLTACDQAPFVFSPLATFTFVLDNASLPNPIHVVYHNGVVVSTRPRDDPHVVYIKVQPYKGITTVIVQSSRNGKWAFG